MASKSAARPYIETTTGNLVSRQSVLCGTSNIQLSGKTIVMPGAVIRGDLANVRVGRCCVLGEGAVLRPPYKRFKGRAGFAFFPQTVGDNVCIGAGAVVEAAYVGTNVRIGADAVVGKRCILKDCCRVEAGTVLPPDSVVPPFSVVGGGVPGRIVEELPECAPAVFETAARENYRAFRRKIQAEKADAKAQRRAAAKAAAAVAAAATPPPKPPPAAGGGAAPSSTVT